MVKELESTNVSTRETPRSLVKMSDHISLTFDEVSSSNFTSEREDKQSTLSPKLPKIVITNSELNPVISPVMKREPYNIRLRK